MKSLGGIIGVAAAALGLNGIRASSAIVDEYYRLARPQRAERPAWPGLVIALYERAARLPPLPPASPARLTKRQRRRLRGKLRAAHA